METDSMDTVSDTVSDVDGTNEAEAVSSTDGVGVFLESVADGVTVCVSKYLCTIE